MEEVIAKTAKKLYLIFYPIFMIFGAIFIGVGAYLETDEYFHPYGWILIALGIFIVICSIVYIIYFAKMPVKAITFKDDKLYFSNGTVCSPAEINHCRATGMGPDGAIFGFGKVFVTLNGKEFKLKYVQNADGAVSRIYMLIAQYQVKQNIAQQAAQQPVESQENNQEDK